MTLKNVRFIATFLVAVTFFNSIFAQKADQLVDVIAVGVGMTQDEAHKAANKAAVAQVVGTMVDATTLVENDELVENKILTYSPGLIAESKIIGTPKKNANGLVTLKVKATVKKIALREKLAAAKLVSVAIDGESLWAQAVSAQDNLANAAAMIKDVLAKHTACVVAEPVPGRTGKSPLDYDSKTGEIFANVRVRIDQSKYTQFANEVVDKIGPMATKKLKLNSKGRAGRYKPDGYFAYSWNHKDYRFLVMTSFKTGSAVAFQLDKNVLNAIVSCLDTGALAIEAMLLDTQGGEIANSHVSLCEKRRGSDKDDRMYLSIFALEEDWREDHWGFVMPFYATDHQLIAQNIWSGVEGTSAGIFRISLGTFTPEELKSVGKLEIKVGHMKGEQFIE